MKRIGLIGGLSWQSTVDYYRIINEESAKRLGGLNNVESIVYSVNLNEMLEHMGKGEVEILGGKFAAVGKKLEEAGADLIVLCTNTMHAACAQLEESIHVPFIHIADATADEIKRLGLHKVGLMGTPFTMGQDFYKGRLRDKHGIEVIVPQESEWNEIYRVIQEELTFGILKDESRKYFLSVIEELRRPGRRGRDPGLHRDPHAHQADRYRSAGAGYHCAACHGSGASGRGTGQVKNSCKGQRQWAAVLFLCGKRPMGKDLDRQFRLDSAMMEAEKEGADHGDRRKNQGGPHPDRADPGTGGRGSGSQPQDHFQLGE